MVFLFAWAGVLVLVGAVLMGGHWIVLPRPATGDPRLGSALAAVSERAGRWDLTHVLYAECRCSRRIFDYLMARPTPPATVERVVLVGEDEDLAARAAQRGFEVVAVSAQELESRFGITSAPLLLISDPEARVVYTGGYTSRKQGPDFKDLDALASLRAGRDVLELPLYGCGVSQGLQRLLDPLGVKYR